MLTTIQNPKVRSTTQAQPNWQPTQQQNLQANRSNQESTQLLQLWALIPPQYLPISFLLDLMVQYDVKIKILSAGLNINPNGDSWLKLRFSGNNGELVRILNHFGSLKILCKIDRTVSFRQAPN
jgi:hypothetical protein